ncbi:MAG: ATP-dependent DNA ligase [Nanoarchaeota archaeon]|nr:ATP-dependent DNA ligase [Nanoarchaeota archaeon]
MKYRSLVDVYEKLGTTSKRLEKTHIISEFLKKCIKENEVNEKVILLLQGKIFHPWENTEIGVAQKLMVKSINICTGSSTSEIEAEWKKTGDLGIVAHNLFSKKKQASLFAKELLVSKVYSNLRRVSEIEGKGTVDTKMQYITEVLINANPLEAKYIVRTVLGDLRIGLGKGTFRDAIVWAYFGEELQLKYSEGNIELDNDERKIYNQFVDEIQHAYDLTNDFSEIIEIIKEKGRDGLKDISLTIGKPINAMLFQKVKNIREAFETVGRPCAFEFKYDGFRLQIHKEDDKVTLFTRRLEDVSAQFPEVVKIIKENISAKSCILDSEAVGFEPNTKKYLPFQKVSQRIRRKYDVERIAEEFPVEVNIFDILYIDGKSTLDLPYKKRRELIEEIVQILDKNIVLSKRIVADDEKVAEKFYKESLESGQEGVMAKNLDSVYKPGSRVGFGVKIKPVMEPLDLVIVTAEYGEGKRSGWLTSFSLACRDENDDLLEIGKASTGLKELEAAGLSFKELTELLKPLINSSKGKEVTVTPKIIIEVAYEEIQKSPTYSSGYALRFPRVLRLREEKAIEEINSISEIENLYKMQRGRSD